MSSFPAADIASPRRRSLFLRIIFWLLLIVALIAAAVFVFAYSITRAALPKLDGTVSVPGLAASVKVTRDGHGVPTIEAANFDDLFFAQGFVTAQDRLWQMDVMRRFGAGELAEILGDDVLKLDREQRILGLRAAARKSLAAAGPRDQSNLKAYASGVNAYIAKQGAHLPLEFRVLRYSPKPWQPEDSIVIANQMVKDLNFYTFRDAFTREKILAKLGPELTADLYINRSWHDRPPTVMREDDNDQTGQPNPGDDDEEMEIDDGMDNSVTHRAPGMPLWAQHSPEAVNGSNDWVVSGAHTVSGKPLLCNDMHLGHQMPNLWYETHLKSGAFDVVGVALPGMPYVIVGHNQRLAWGFTNVGPTVADGFIETFNEQGEYQTPQGWQHPEHRPEVIHVKGQADVTLDVQITRHGPVITDLLPGETRAIALRWSLYDGLRMPFYDIDSAQNWDDFRKALAQLDAPGQNVVYADIDGNIGYQATGRVPIRASGDGSLPVNGSNDAHEWTGYIPFDNLPSIFNPPSGVIATANGRIAPDKYPKPLSAEWEAPWRTARIYHVLESGGKFAPADMLALQNDVQSESDLFAAEHFVYAADHSAKISGRAKQAADILRSWDGRMLGSAAAPTIVVRASNELTRLLLEPRLGPAPEGAAEQEVKLNWKSYEWEMRTVWLQNVMLHQPKRWLPPKYSSFEALLTAALEAAVNSADAPKDLTLWRWGPVNELAIDHPVLGKIPLLARWTAPGVHEQSGSGYTVKAVTRHHGPSERFTANLADLDQSTLNTVTGQGGNFLSPFYMDQWKAWYEGKTFLLPFSPQAVRRNAAHTLSLEPAHN